ncbi:MAG: macro domain-containing protein [Deltaproteobacteria bacterium]|jgi:O-acetyl-ADP-ribose deacetylase (regulator of RNase III)|nr:macro domain-containing protein [Deltaproteobacteria bacterium]MDA8307097.1 macro domain-containing protein [Deltaproteobacteria bacterium]
MEKIINGKKLVLVLGDITELAVEAIVNAANSGLQLGGGVAGAIRTKGGPSIQQECNRIGPIRVGEAVLTGGGSLKASYVIHAVGPVYGEGNEDEKLRNATLGSLERATEKGIKSIAFPAISTGIFGFPKDRCARIMLKAVSEFLAGRETSLEKVIFCLWSGADLDLFEKTLAEAAAAEEPPFRGA